MASAQVANPQTWNRYTYALNNPLRNVDPDGLEAKPVFKPYDQLTEDERRILENSKITVGKGKDAKVLSGSGLYNHLSQHNGFVARIGMKVCGCSEVVCFFCHEEAHLPHPQLERV